MASIGSTLGKKLGDKASDVIAKTTGRKAAGEVAMKASGKVSKEIAAKAAAEVLGKDTLKVTAKAAEVAAPTVNDALKTAVAKVKMAIAAYSSPGVIGNRIGDAAAAATTTTEALQVAVLARDLANKSGKGAAMSNALSRAVELAATPDEAAVALKSVTGARMDDFVRYHLDDVNQLTTAGVDKFLRSTGDTDSLITQALRMVKRYTFDRKPPSFYVRPGAVEKTLEEKIAAIASYMNTVLPK